MSGSVDPIVGGLSEVTGVARSCGFCGRGGAKIRLLGNERGDICDECLTLCHEMVLEEIRDQSDPK